MATNAEELSQGVDTQPTGQPQQTGQAPSGDSLYAEFLQQVPEAQRPLIEPHLKKWDAGVTKRFQELHSKYRPYEELGTDPEQLGQAVQLMEALEDPEQQRRIYEYFKEQFEAETGAGAQPQPGATEEEVYSTIPPEFTQRLEKSERLLEQVAQFILTSRQKEMEAEEEAELDQTLDQLREKHGDFDEDWVIVRMARGMDAEEAVQAWNNLIQERVNSAGSGNGLPPTLHGGGAVPAETVNLKDMARNDVKGLVAGLLSQANQEGE